MRNNSNSYEVIILKRQAVFEVDAIFTGISRESGKVFFKAVGVNKGKSKLSGRLCVPGYVRVKVAGGQLPVVTEVEEVEVFERLRLDHMLMPYVHFGLEVVLKSSVEHDPNDSLFALLRDFLCQLNSGSDVQVATEKFLVDVNRSLGVHTEGTRMQELVNNLEAFIDRTIVSKNFLESL